MKSLGDRRGTCQRAAFGIKATVTRQPRVETASDGGTIWGQMTSISSCPLRLLTAAFASLVVCLCCSTLCHAQDDDALHIDTARAAIDKKDCPQAVNEVNSVSEDARNTPKFLSVAGDAYACVGNYEKALEYYKEYDRRLPGNAQIKQAMGDANYHLQKLAVDAHDAQVAKDAANGIRGRWRVGERDETAESVDSDSSFIQITEDNNGNVTATYDQLSSRTQDHRGFHVGSTKFVGHRIDASHIQGTLYFGPDSVDPQCNSLPDDIKQDDFVKLNIVGIHSEIDAARDEYKIYYDSADGSCKTDTTQATGEDWYR